VYGFAVDPARQGRGIGRDVLRRVCHQLRREGVGTIGLEVEVDNDSALGLYTSLGFVRVTTEDYFAVPLATRRSVRASCGPGPSSAGGTAATTPARAGTRPARPPSRSGTAAKPPVLPRS